METITFEFIRRIQIVEQRSSKLAKIPDNFYESIRDYLERKRSMKSGRRDELEIKNIERLVRNIYNLRERKIINAAIIKVRTGVDPQNLIPEEKEFYEKIVEIIKKRREKNLEGTIIPKVEKETVEMVVFKQDFPEFVGVDGKTYGPFKKGDIAKLPKENMDVLESQGIVEKFKIEK